MFECLNMQEGDVKKTARDRRRSAEGYYVY